MAKSQKKLISIDSDNLEFLENEYPDWSLQWAVNELLHALQEVSGSNTPRQQARTAAKLFLEQSEL